MPLKLMTVDDSRTIRRIVATYAKELIPDVEVVEATNGQECVDKCKESPPDLVILDINMPVMTGEECLRNLRADESTKAIPVVMLTTESEKSVVVRLLQLGVQQFIIKPFEKQEFLDKIGGVVAKIAQSSGAKVAGSLPTPAGRYAIVLEDKGNITRTIADAAEGILEVVSTKTTVEAMRHFKKKAPDVVLANLSMADADAFDLFIQMRKIPDRQDVRYMGMCLKTASDLIRRARGTGYIKVLGKPFTAEYVKDALSRTGKNTVETETSGDVLILRCTGDSFPATIPLISKAIEAAAEEGFFKVLIDLSALPEASLDDVSLWGMVAEKPNGLGMAASYLSPSAEIVAKLKEVLDTQSLKVATDEEEALQALAA